MSGLGMSNQDSPVYISYLIHRPLNPDACVSTELHFLPLTVGRLPVEAIRVIDVVTNDSIDIRDVPDIVVEA